MGNMYFCQLFVVQNQKSSFPPQHHLVFKVVTKNVLKSALFYTKLPVEQNTPKEKKLKIPDNLHSFFWEGGYFYD